MSEGYERMKARRAARDASGTAYVDGSIYENMAACVVRSGATLAHVPSYVVAEEIAAALNATATPGALDPATVERLAASLCDNPDARLIAGQEDAPAFEDSSPHVQSYWRALAEHLATDPHQHGGKGA